jgi:hypothetical protein
MQFPATVVDTLLLSHVYVPPRGGPFEHELLNSYNEGWLVCRASVRALHREFPERSYSSISRDIRDLEARGLVEIYEWEKGAAPLIKLGSWQKYRHPDGRVQHINVWFIDTIFGPAGE